MNDFDSELQQRIRRRLRPVQYLLLHVFLMVSFLITLGISVGLELITEDQLMVAAVVAVLSLIAHGFWRANLEIRSKITEEERERLERELAAEKPKRDRLGLTDDGEISYYEDGDQAAQQLGK